MQSYEETLHYIHTVEPALIYLSIGCAEAAEQQLPPQVQAWPGQKVCILIDPRLESPPRAFPDYPTQRTAYSYDNGVTVIPMAAHFYWPCYLARGYDVCDAEVDKHMDFLEKLIVLTTAALPNTHLIVQDYSGTDIRKYYPLDKFDRHTLCQRVLFDMTYGDGCCFVDFNKVHIYRRSNSDFVQPLYEPLANLRADLPPDLLQSEMERRHRIVNYYLTPFYRIQRGWAEKRDWCTAATIFDQAQQLFPLYNVPVTEGTVRTLISFILHDSMVAVGKVTSHEALEEILDDPDMKRITNELSIIRQGIQDQITPASL